MLLRDDPLPPFRRAADIRRSASVALRPPQRITVAEAAEKHRRLNNPGSYVGPWQNQTTPYLVEPMNRCRSRSVREVHIVAPSQSGKTEVPLNVIGHAVKCQPADILFIQPTKDLALDFAERRIENKLLRPSPDLRFELRSDKVLQKTFRNGSMLTIAWPVPSQLASRPVPLVVLDERDRMPDDVGSEGDPVELARNRVKTYGRNGKVIVTSSPSRDYASGVVAHFYEGDQNLWFWPCPHCGEYFSPGFDENRRPAVIFDSNRRPIMPHLAIKPGWGPEELREHGCGLVCPHCGQTIAEIEKGEMNARGVWLPRGASIAGDGTITGDRPSVRISSFWLSGLATPFETWGELAAKFVEAVRHFERTGSEEKLKTVFNTGFGFPYIAVNDNTPPVEIAALIARQEPAWRFGTVPGWVRFLVASVDSQKRRFAVSVIGFDEHGASGLVDRFDIENAPDGAQIDPANVAAHWDLLAPMVLHRAWPLAADAALEMPVACMVCDTGGMAGDKDIAGEDAGVHMQARNFARRLLFGPQAVQPWRLMLVKGASRRHWPMLPDSPKWETDDLGRRRPDAVAVYTIGVHLLKNLVDNRLRIEPTAKADHPLPVMRFPATVPAGYFEELTAETRVAGKWEKTGPNESWDLWVYAEAGRQRLRTDRVKDWTHPPAWALPRRRDPAAASFLPGAAAAPLATARRPGRRMLSHGIRI